MGELKIRAIRSVSNEAESRYAVIDTFEDVNTHYTYYCGCEIFQTRFKNGMTVRGIEIENPKLSFKDKGFDCVESCDDDVFEAPDIALYLGLSRALKASGYVFNKKLARLYKNPRKKKGKTN
jgi:hypothetical protein